MDDKNNARKLGATLASVLATVVCVCVSSIAIAIIIRLGMWIIHL